MLSDKAAEILQAEWKRASELAEAGKLTDVLDDPKLIQAIKESINSATKTYRYVLPTQVVSKLADPSLDSRSIQAARGKPGSFDARSIAHKVLVPFDQSNESVLGGSQEPYINNPVRVPEVSLKYRNPQKDKPGWDRLRFVLDTIENKNDPDFTVRVFQQILTEIYRRLSMVRVVYGVPRRVSLKKTVQVIQAFLADHSGGDRLMALTSALFTVIGKRFGLYETVKRGNITQSDQAGGMLADLECMTKDGQIAFAVEVKDRQITINQLRAKLRTIREKQVSEIFFVAQGTILNEEAEVQELIDREFAAGQNVYVTDLVNLSTTALAILGEEGRRDFLMETANQLETYRSEITHRRAWAALLQKL
jgi:SacI-like restriction endonuclease